MSTANPQPQRRFTRKALNIIILLVAMMIMLFSQTDKFMGSQNKTPDEATSQNQSKPPKEESLIAQQNQKPSPSEVTTRDQLTEIRDSVEKLERPSVSIDIQSWEHDSGALIVFVESPEIPMVDIRMVFDAGSARDEHLPGLAKMTNSLIGEGTELLSVNQIARQFEDLGSNFTTDSYRDMAIVSLRTLSESTHLEPSLALFTQVVSQPSFPEDALNRVRSIMKLSIEKAKASPHSLISQATWANLYANHPYGHFPGGTQESLDKITAEALKQFHQSHYTQANLRLAIVGAINWEKAKAMAEKILRALPAGKPLEPLPEATPLEQPKTVHITFPSQQTHIRLATLTTQKSDERHIPMALANAVFGGSGFASKLNQIIRQDNGLAYSVYSQAGAMQSQGMFSISLQTKNESAGKALALSKKTLTEFLSEGITQEELIKTKNYLVASFPLGLASNSSILSQLGYIAYYRLPLDYLDQYTKTISDLTSQQSAEAFNQIIGSQPLLTVTLGPEPVTEDKPSQTTQADQN